MPSGRSLALAKGPSRPRSGQIEKPPIPDVPETHFFISGPRARPKARLSTPSDHCVQRTSSVPGRLRKEGDPRSDVSGNAKMRETDPRQWRPTKEADYRRPGARTHS